ncbi:MAG: hypothetical protein ACRD0Y_08895 [Terriglobales bacterium]
MGLPEPIPPREPQAPEGDTVSAKDREYDETIADSFPASDPPSGVIKVGPRHIPPERELVPKKPSPPAR